MHNTKSFSARQKSLPTLVFYEYRRSSTACGVVSCILDLLQQLGYTTLYLETSHTLSINDPIYQLHEKSSDCNLEVVTLNEMHPFTPAHLIHESENENKNVIAIINHQPLSSKANRPREIFHVLSKASSENIVDLYSKRDVHYIDNEHQPERFLLEILKQSLIASSPLQYQSQIDLIDDYLSF